MNSSNAQSQCAKIDVFNNFDIFWLLSALLHLKLVTLVISYCKEI